MILFENILNVLNDKGYELLEKHYFFCKNAKRNNVIIRDSFGYLYDVSLSSALNSKGFNFVHKGNPYSLKNIETWILMNEKTFDICLDNVYLGDSALLKFYCNKCDSFFFRTWHDIFRNRECSECGKVKVARDKNNLEYLFPDVSFSWDFEKNIFGPNKFTPHSLKSVWWKCDKNIHESYERSISVSLSYSFRCPKCSMERYESILQEKIRKYIEDIYGFIVLHEFSCTIIPTNPNTGYKLPFDNEVQELNLIIETMGKQHYEITGFHYLKFGKDLEKCRKELDYQKWKDNYKRKYALSSGYEYLEIPYWTDDENQTWKSLISNKIQSLMHD
jgi:hypothetical protein